MSDGNREVLGAINSLKELFEAKQDATNEKLDMVHTDVQRNQLSIRQLYELDREQSTCISNLRADVLPAISHAKNSSKMTIGFVLSAIGVLGVSFGNKIVEIIKGAGS